VPYVLDASALLAYLFGDTGADGVADALSDGAHVSSVNLAEALSIIAGRAADPPRVVEDLAGAGVLGDALTVEPFTLTDAIDTARLRPLTREQRLALGDRACLALARRLGLPALTSDRAWTDTRVAVEIAFVG
jgi:ribonuclease VapC